MKISAINTYTVKNRQNNINNHKNNTNKNLNPSFSGHTENPIIINEYDNISCYILGQDMRPMFQQSDYRVKSYDKPEKIADFLAENILAYSANFDKNRTFERTAEKNNTKFYVADPYETVTDEIRSKHGYIIYDNEPKFPTLEELREKYSSREVDAHDYFADLRDYITYQQRVVSADEDRLENPVEKNTPQQEEEYKERMNKANQKVQYAQNLFNIMYKSGQDFMYKDQLVNNLADIQQKSKIADVKLETIAFEKYLLDETIPGTERHYENEAKNPTDMNYKLRLSLLQGIRYLKERSEQMQQEYDMYAHIKDHAPEMIASTQEELNRTLGRMGRNFEEVKAFYENNNLENI